MRQRITFVHAPGQAPNAQLLQITDTSVSGLDFSAVREDRLTIPLDELPREISELFRASCRELHVRYVSPSAFESQSPLSSRMSPGLHVFLTPAPGAPEKTIEAFIVAFTSVFGLKHLTEKGALERHFTSLATEHSETSEMLQYYEPLDSPSSLVALLKRAICQGAEPCASRAETLESAASIDISLSATTGTSKFTAQWPFQEHHLSVSAMPGHRTEVGILGLDSAAHKEEHDLGVSGVLTVIGEHKTPSPVVFSVPARHRQAEATFTSAFLRPTGLHPALQLNISSSRPPVDDGSCALHAHFTLPKTIFADRYQLSDDLFLASKNLAGLRYSSSPVDLEAPVYAVPTWGSSVLLELAPPPADHEGSWTAEVPLHLRYLEPNSEGYGAVEVPYPAVFWACAADPANSFSNNPFDRDTVGYDSLFSPKTAMWHVTPKPVVGDRLMSPISVPVLDSDDAGWVRSGTAAAIGLGFAIVLSALVTAFFKYGYRRQGVEGGDKAKKTGKKDGKEKKKQ